MMNCNPETVSTDYDTSSRLYFEPLTVEDVLNVVDKERPDGIIVQFGGQTPLSLASQLQRALKESPIPAASGGVHVWQAQEPLPSLDAMPASTLLHHISSRGLPMCTACLLSEALGLDRDTGLDSQGLRLAFIVLPGPHCLLLRMQPCSHARWLATALRWCGGLLHASYFLYPAPH